MIIHDIGATAGKIWKALHTEGEMSLPALKKALGAKNATVDWAIGWLAREDKLTFRKEKNVLMIALKR